MTLALLILCGAWSAGLLPAVAQQNTQINVPPVLGRLSERVTDPDSVLYIDEARTLEAKLEELYRTRDLDFYLVIKSQPLQESATDLAARLQRETVSKGFGGVVLVSFADNSVSVFLTPDALQIISQPELLQLLERAAQAFSSDRPVAANLDAMTNEIFGELDRLRDAQIRRTRAAPFWALVWVIVGSFLIASIVGGYIVLRQQNQFGRSYYLRVHPPVMRFGGGKSGGHCAEMGFSPRKLRGTRR